MHARPNPEQHLRLDPGPERPDEVRALREQAERCRRLSEATYERETRMALRAMADGFDKTADALANKRG